MARDKRPVEPRRSAEARCGPCHWNHLLAGGSGRAELLGFLVIDEDEGAVTFARFGMRGANTIDRWKAEQGHDSITRTGSIVTIPDLLAPVGGSLRLRCRRARHRLKTMTEDELRDVVENPPATASAFYWPAA